MNFLKTHKEKKTFEKVGASVVGFTDTFGKYAKSTSAGKPLHKPDYSRPSSVYFNVGLTNPYFKKVDKPKIKKRVKTK